MEDYREQVRTEIVDIFRNKIKGRREPIRQPGDPDGAIGHWLETQFGLTANGYNAPDFKGFELKKDTRDKTTFGDWSADRYLFSTGVGACSRDDFLEIFGSPNPDGRFSWSGSCFPKVGFTNSFGQRIHVTNDGNVVATYDYAQDSRQNKDQIVPLAFRNGLIPLAYWTAENLRRKVEDKFNVFGWFSVRKNNQGFYDAIVFGDPIDFNFWISQVREGTIYLDSGMYQGNPRPYQNWRASNTLWDSLIVAVMS